MRRRASKVTDGHVIAQQFDDAAQQRTASDLGMWIFLATELLFFGVLFAAYTITRIHFPEAFAIASKLTNVTLGSINTGVLLTSSLTMALAIREAKLGARIASIIFMCSTIVLGLVFLAIKGGEYYLDYIGHLVPALDFAYPGAHAGEIEIFFFLYFVMTGVHALHLIIGLVFVGAMVAMTSRNAFSPDYYTPVELSGLYWHLIDIIWIFLYPLLYLVSRS
jgi:cytochrome c oxidase subunit 3